MAPGRGDEARPFLDVVLQKPEADIDVVNHVGPSLAYVDIAWAKGDPQLALEHAHRAFSLAVQSDNPYLRVYAQACRGLAYTIAGNFRAAIEDLAGALRFARSRKAGLENEARILADLADAHRLNGDAATALDIADESIAIATARHARVPECRARLVRAAILLGSRTADHKVAAEEIARARKMMHETGALIYQPLIDALTAEGNPGGQANSAISTG